MKEMKERISKMDDFERKQIALNWAKLGGVVLMIMLAVFVIVILPVIRSCVGLGAVIFLTSCCIVYLGR